jgi:hypothetical protein
MEIKKVYFLLFFVKEMPLIKEIYLYICQHQFYLFIYFLCFYFVARNFPNNYWSISISFHSIKLIWLISFRFPFVSDFFVSTISLFFAMWLWRMSCFITKEMLLWLSVCVCGWNLCRDNGKINWKNSVAFAYFAWLIFAMGGIWKQLTAEAFSQIHNLA